MTSRTAPPRCALVGSVSFSRVTLEALLRNGLHVCGVLGLTRERASNVSDYARLDDLAAAHAVPYRDFTRVNEPDVVDAVKEWKPDLLFVVGLSQLVREELLSLPERGCIGFHPTLLPRGRGRAPVAWLTYDATPGAASFFLMNESTDSGPIFVQEPFDVGPSSTSAEVIIRVRDAIGRALDRWLPRLAAGEWNPVPQDESQATWFGRRAAEDGLIEWSHGAAEIDRLVRAAGRPYPGAYSYVGGSKLIVWKTEIERDPRFRGVVGRVLDADPERGLLVQAGDGLLWLREWELQNDGGDRRISVGTRLGYSADDEINALRRRVAALERTIEALAEQHRR